VAAGDVIARFGKAALVLVLGLALAELGLQLASRFASDRSSAWKPDTVHRILCVGDSHTYGAGVEREETYPAQLQALLETREPGVYSVINMGLPGLSAAQLHSRIGVWLHRYRPDLLVVWVGVNDSWNLAELEGGASGIQAKLDGLLVRSRLYRLIRVTLHDRALDRYVPQTHEELSWHVSERDDVLGPRATYTVRHDGVTERITHLREAIPPADPAQEARRQTQARIERHLSAIAELGEAAGTPLLLLTYPIEASWYQVANRAARSVATRYDLALVETSPGASRLTQEEQDWTWGTHPGPRIYGEIAAEVAPAVAAAPEEN
jgi:lysophospholipase L1-like esterase